MEGECYDLIWGVMHFRQYLHMKHFILRTYHKSVSVLCVFGPSLFGYTSILVNFWFFVE